MNAIDRKDPLWRQLFFESWRHLLSIDKTEGGGIIAGPRLAQSAAALADDGMREALGLGSPPACVWCAGVGCKQCGFSGRSSAGAVVDDAGTAGLGPSVGGAGGGYGGPPTGSHGEERDNEAPIEVPK